MPREPRVVAVGLPHHITQRGNARQDVFTTDALRRAYLELLSEHAAGNRLRLLAYCLMTNHVHIVAVPEADSSMANTFRHAHGRFLAILEHGSESDGAFVAESLLLLPGGGVGRVPGDGVRGEQPGAGWHGGTRGRFRMVERGRAPGQGGVAGTDETIPATPLLLRAPAALWDRSSSLLD
ncbi:MAG: transposase [Acidobacteriia bacterium]|nr:transposase [Terriglobia bacterium]